MLDDLPNVTQLKGVEPGFKCQLRSSRIYVFFTMNAWKAGAMSDVSLCLQHLAQV